MTTPHETTITTLASLLKTLSHILQKASTTEGLTESTLLTTRLHEGMYPLPDQIRLATQFSVYLVARLTDSTPHMFEGNPSSLHECQSRINTVLSILEAADKQTVNAQAEILKSTPVGPGKEVQMSGADYAHRIVLPNVYFHVGIAYAILRSLGVEIGKRDWYAGFFEMDF